MKNITTIQDVYPAVEELIPLLKEQGYTELSCILEHRMHEVTWTSASELYEELRDVLCDAMSKFDTTDEIGYQMKKLVAVIEAEGCI